MINQEEEVVQNEQQQDPIVEAKVSEPAPQEDPNVIKVDLRNLETDAVQ